MREILEKMAEKNKLKKPVENHFQDLRSLAAREANCRIEVRLNRRLAREIYLGVVPITREASGGLALAGEGDVVDWLVHMRRLPAASPRRALSTISKGL